MKTLIRFLFKYHFVLLFLLFELISFTILVQSNSFHRASFLNSSGRMIAGMLESVQEIKDYFYLKEANAVLAYENAVLRNVLRENYESNTVFKREVEDSLLSVHYEYYPAKVVNNSINKQHNYITLNKGAVNGIESEMGVVVNNSLVGVVKNVSKHYCTVISVINKHLSISAKIKKNNYYGSVHWYGNDYKLASLDDIPFHVNLEVGDTVVTTGFSSIFPENINIGVISNFTLEEGKNFYDIEIKLTTDFQSISYVYIIDNLLKKERLNLEEENDD